MKKFPQYFSEIIKADFLERPNRFLVKCTADKLGIIEAYLPNPGRLWELLLPGTILYICREIKQKGTPSAKRKTRFTVLAVQSKGSIIFLHTHLTNKVARYLIEEKFIPPLNKAEVVKEEVTKGKSRFDFLLTENGRDFFLEVKSCTLFGNGVAMFPDAVTERGKRHLLELSEMGKNGPGPVILFIVHNINVNWFMPDFHTDYDFSVAMLEARNNLTILPVAIEWKPDLTFNNAVKILEIPWEYIEKEVKDRGSYLLILRLDREKVIPVGKMGYIPFKKGYFLYVGSAMRNLTARIKRHQRKRKKMHWHIDYLTQVADEIIPVPVRSSLREECEIARAISSIMENGPRGFGSSDCNCITHLYYSERHPLQTKAFHEVLQKFRMKKPS